MLPLYSVRYFLTLLLFNTLQAQSQHMMTYQYSQSTILSIHSEILNEDRKIYIHCPKHDSSNLDKRFPTLYILDADNHFELVAQYADYLSRPDVLAIPEIIVVGISNTDRRRDLTPTKSILNYLGKPDSGNLSKPSGGNENFLQFIRTELMPTIDKNYKTEPYRIFAGHSFGGLTSINCMLTHPGMFDAYIAVSPSLYWDNRYVLKETEKTLKKSSVLNKKLFYSNGNEGEEEGKPSLFHKDVLKFDALIKGKRLEALDYMYRYYPNETHMTAPIVAYFDALRFIFRDWEKTQPR